MREDLLHPKRGGGDTASLHPTMVPFKKRKVGPS